MQKDEYEIMNLWRTIKAGQNEKSPPKRAFNLA
jgi:hypothetical protein